MCNAPLIHFAFVFFFFYFHCPHLSRLITNINVNIIITVMEYLLCASLCAKHCQIDIISTLLMKKLRLRVVKILPKVIWLVRGGSEI